MAPIDLVVDEKKKTNIITTASTINTTTDAGVSSLPSPSAAAVAVPASLLQILVNNNKSSTNDSSSGHQPLVVDELVDSNNSVVGGNKSGETKRTLVASRDHKDNTSDGEEDEEDEEVEEQFNKNVDNTSQEEDEEEDENVSTASSYSTSSLSPMSDDVITTTTSCSDQQLNGQHATTITTNGRSKKLLENLPKHESSSTSTSSSSSSSSHNEIGIVEEEEPSPTPTLTPSDMKNSNNHQSSSLTGTMNFTDDEKQHRFIEFYPSNNTTNLTDSQLAASASNHHHTPSLTTSLQPPSSLPIIRPSVDDGEPTSPATATTTVPMMMNDSSSSSPASSSSVYVPSQTTQAIYSPNGLVTYHHHTSPAAAPQPPPPMIYHQPMYSGGLLPSTNPPPYSINNTSQPSADLVAAPQASILSLSPSHHHHHHNHHQITTPDHSSSSVVASLATSPITSIMHHSSASSPVLSADGGGGGAPATTTTTSNAVTSTPSSTIYVHVDVGHVFQMQLGDEMKEVVGPAMVKIVNNDSTQPVPLQLTAPAPGQYVQQLLDEHGMLQHIIISSNPPPSVVVNTATTATTVPLPPPPSLTSQPVLAQQSAVCVNNNKPVSIPNTSAAFIPSNNYAAPSHLMHPYQQQQQQPPVNNNTNNNTLHHSHHYNNKTSNGVNKPTYLHHNGGKQANNNNKLHPSYSIPSPYGISSSYPVNSSNNTATASNNSSPNNNNSTSNGSGSSSSSSSSSYASVALNNTTTLPVISSTPSYHHIHQHYHQYNQYNNNKSQAYLLNQPQQQQQQTPSPPSSSQSPQPLPLLVAHHHHHHSPHFVAHLDNEIGHHPQQHQYHHSSNNNNSSIVDNSTESSTTNSERFIIGGTTTTSNSNSNNNNNSNNTASNSVSPLSSSSCSSTSIGGRSSGIIVANNNNSINNEQQSFTSQNNSSRFRKPNQQQQQQGSTYLIRPSNNNNNSLKSLNRPVNNNKTYNNKAQYLNSSPSSSIVQSSPTGPPTSGGRVLNHNKLYKQHPPKFPVMMVNQQHNHSSSNVVIQPVESQMVATTATTSTATPVSKAHELIAKNLLSLSSLLTSRTQRPVLGEIDARTAVVFLAAIDMPDQESIINGMTTLDIDDTNGQVADSDSTSGSGDKNGDESSLDEETRAELRDKFQRIIYSLELASCGSVSSSSVTNNNTPVDSPPSTNFSKVFSADAKDTTEVTLKDLKPNTKYLLRTFATLTSSCHGEYVPYPPMAFQTKPCEPDALQQPPKLCGQKKKNELTLKWAQGAAPIDNGSKITSYILEYQEIKNPLNDGGDHDQVLSHDHFETAYKGPLKQATVKKLQPSTCYAFRVSAENAYGRGPCSPTAFIYTTGSVPTQPEAPSLVDATVSSLTLTWRLPTATTNSTNMDTQYELQMLDLNDPFNYNIYLTVYNGPASCFTVSNLRRGTSVLHQHQLPVYQFRVRAYNEEGYSAWSDGRKFSTRPDRPQAPTKLRVTRLAAAAGNVSTSMYKCVWEGPRDSGGAPVHTFTLEIRPADNNNNTDDSYQQIYSGDQCEFIIDADLLSTLRPGCTYLLRVCCANEAGQSDYSSANGSEPPVLFTVPAILPGVCQAPKLNAKPKSNTAQFRWSPPVQDGGSPILGYELRLCETESQCVSIHKSNNGDECSLCVDSLLPGRAYTAQLRAVNKLGACREWSEPPLEFMSGAGAPDAPPAPNFVIKSPTCLQVAWQEVNGNGAPIVEYRLEWAEKTDNNHISFVQLYSGTAQRYELRGGFQAASRYLFRLQAVNANGSPSPYSPIVDFLTPAQVPAQIQHVRLEELGTQSALVVWKQPSNNGSPIQSYNIDLIDNSTSNITITNSSSSQQQSATHIVVHHEDSANGEMEHLLEHLQPDTVYKVRIQAANQVGVGQFSAVHKFRTRSYPPQAPANIECISSTYNCIKLKWSPSSVVASSLSSSTVSAANTDQQIVYVLEMMAKPQKKQHLVEEEEERNDDKDGVEETTKVESLLNNEVEDEEELQFVQVYRGNVNAFKAGKLNESTEYWFRVAACNEAGLGKWSNVFKFQTTTAPPSVTKAPVISEITTNSCLVEWLPAVKSSSTTTEETMTLEYCLQLKSSNDNEYREVYRGLATTSYRLVNLDPNVEYCVRVCATRLVVNSDHHQHRLVSPFSPLASFTTLRLPKQPLSNNNRQKTSDSTSSSSLADSIMSNQRTKKAGGGGKNSSSFVARLMAYLTPVSMNKKINENAKPQQMIQQAAALSMQQQQQQQQKAVKQPKRVSRYQDVNSHLVSSSQKSSLNNTSSSTMSSSNGGVTSSLLGIRRESADQYWAFGMILVLLAIAFVIAYLGMQFYDLSSIIQTEVETSTATETSSSSNTMNHHRISEF